MAWDSASLLFYVQEVKLRQGPHQSNRHSRSNLDKVPVWLGKKTSKRMSVGETDSSQTVQNIHMLQHVIPTIPRTWSCLKGYLTQFWCNTIHKHKWNICIYYTFSFLTIMLMTKFRTDAIWWSHLQLMQVVPSGGQICRLCRLNWCDWKCQ